MVGIIKRNIEELVKRTQAVIRRAEETSKEIKEEKEEEAKL